MIESEVMGQRGILKELEKGGRKPEELVRRAIRNPDRIPEIIEGVNSKKADVKFGSAKILRLISEQNADLLYPYWEHFEERLSSDNTFLRSDSIFVLANLTCVDTDKKFEKIFNKCYDMLNDESMIPAANLAGISGRIAMEKPHLQGRIINKLLKIDDTRHSSECKNIIKGKVIESFSEFFETTSKANKKKIITFIKKELRNPRQATRRKAENFLKKWS
jgi:hypothetical protein